MDTKWNSTDARPGETADFIPEAGKKRGQRKAVLAFAAFFLGISLTVGSLGSAPGWWLRQGRTEAWTESDWQATQAFRDQVSGYLEEFLTIGAGGELSWYGTALVQDYAVDTTYGWGGNWDFAISDTPVADVSAPASPVPDEPDAFYRNDRNVLYQISGKPGAVSRNCRNTEDSLQPLALPKGYNFLLTFADGTVSAWKDGQKLNIYGDGVYDEDSLWFVPGYENFQAGEDVDGVTVSIAVRQVPMQYLQGDYANGGVSRNNRMYWLYRDFQQSRAELRHLLVLFGAGLALLAVWFVLRKDRWQADRKIASWTVHVWTELRFLAVAGCLVYLLAGNTSRASFIWPVQNLLLAHTGGWPDGFAFAISCLVGLPLSNLPALLGLVWLVWLIRNDHRYNPREKRRSLLGSLFRILRTKDLKYPIQKRLCRRALVGPIGLAVMAVVCPLAILFLSRVWWWNIYVAFLAITVSAFFIVMIWLFLSARREMALARDIGLLADQVESIRGGDLSTPLALPADADLRETAEHLNDIQAGLHKAVAEQTRSERMKVELVSNVSHDLKTPLTSILSYAELLRQEPLEDAAADYARIIDEKAQRLKAMVQDVFEVSKAASDQLPVKLERLDFAKLLRQTLADMDENIQKSGLTFRVDLPEHPVEITADGKRLYRVFQNLIQNALQYTLEGSRVYLTLTVDQGRAEALVRNTSRTELPAGTDFTARFVRGDESRTDGGSGLGLSIAKSFTDACGGDFRVETVADLFTAVVTFPLAKP